jgi:hypothetical protein
MEIRRLLYSKYSSAIISIILGFGLATLFRKVCNKRNCIVFRSPNIKNIEGKVIKYDDTCYKFTHKSTPYDKNKKDIYFA